MNAVDGSVNTWKKWALENASTFKN